MASVAHSTYANPVRSQLDKIAEGKKSRLIVGIQENSIAKMVQVAEKVAPFVVAILVSTIMIDESLPMETVLTELGVLRQVAQKDNFVVIAHGHNLTSKILEDAPDAYGPEKEVMLTATWADFITVQSRYLTSMAIQRISLVGADADQLYGFRNGREFRIISAQFDLPGSTAESRLENEAALSYRRHAITGYSYDKAKL